MKKKSKKKGKGLVKDFVNGIMIGMYWVKETIDRESLDQSVAKKEYSDEKKVKRKL